VKIYSAVKNIRYFVIC